MLSIGGGLAFEDPAPWNPAFSAALDGRWHPIKVAFLRNKGVKLFAWINPGEVLTSMRGVEWRVCEHGAFVYLFHEDLQQEDERDMFFCIKAQTNAVFAEQIGRICSERAPERTAMDSESLLASGLRGVVNALVSFRAKRPRTVP